MSFCSCGHCYRDAHLSVFRVVTALAVGCEIGHGEWIHCAIAVHLGWSQHLQAARLLELAPDDQRGLALALMGMALLILVEDLARQEA